MKGENGMRKREIKTKMEQTIGLKKGRNLR
jgi:hypothetical protein